MSRQKYGPQRLTALAVTKIPPDKTRREISDLGCLGLFLVLQPSGARSWALRYRHDGKPRKLTLGPAIMLGKGEAEPGQPAIGDALTLAGARKLATESMHLLKQGRDPGTETLGKDRAAADTFQAVAEEYLKREGKRLRTVEWRRTVLERLVYPAIGRRRIGEVLRLEIVRLLDRIEDKNGPVMADRTLAVIRKIMNWHASRSERFNSPIVRGMARTRPKERARQRTLTDDELRAIWGTAESYPGVFGAYIQFILLTGARRLEAAKLNRTEIIGTDWILPPTRNKTKLEFVRPLSEAARKVLARLPEIGTLGLVFTSDGTRALGGFGKPKRAFDKACGVEGWVLHDLRRSARSLMSRAGVPADHAEICLGHALPGVRHVYVRHEYYAEKARAFEALAALIGRIVHEESDNVVPIRREQ
jgi:integrase